MCKNFITTLFIILLLCSELLGFEPPDHISSWHSVSEHTVNIVPTSTSEDLGRVVYKNYMNGKSSLQVILTEGEGTGELYVPEKVNEAKGLMPAEAKYKVLEISGYRAILEQYEYMPLVLAVNLNGYMALTLETFSLNEEEIVSFAEKFIKKLLTYPKF